MSIEEFNKELIKLFQIIPRKMQKVSYHLAGDKDSFEKIISREQDTLDAMAGQVYKPVEKKVSQQVNSDTISILDKMGIVMDDIDTNDEKIIKKLLSKESEGRYVKAWRVTNLKSDERFKKYCEENHITNKKLFFHGTRSQNVFSILRSSLLLKPSNVIINGQMFGYAHKSDGSVDTNAALNFAPKSSFASSSDKLDVYLSYATKAPYMFIGGVNKVNGQLEYSNYNWYYKSDKDQTFKALWGDSDSGDDRVVVKSLYDPCPAGWRQSHDFKTPQKTNYFVFDIYHVCLFCSSDIDGDIHGITGTKFANTVCQQSGR